MALYDGEYEAALYSASSSNIFRGKAEESLQASYHAVTTEYFMGAKTFRRCCVNRVQNFADGSLDYNEYILFTGVSVQDMVTVDKVHGSLPKICGLYDAKEKILIVKLMLGIGHETLSLSLFVIFSDKLRDLRLRDHILCTGSARFGDIRRHKEANQSFKPKLTCLVVDAWPSLTFEVGFSESLLQLRNDACFWLTQSQLQTSIVVIFHIDRVQKKIQIEQWEVVIPQRPQRASIHYPPTVGCEQRIDLGKGDVYTGPPLELAIDKVFDVVPPNLAAGALDFTALELQTRNDTFWLDFP